MKFETMSYSKKYHDLCRISFRPTKMSPTFNGLRTLQVISIIFQVRCRTESLLCRWWCKRIPCTTSIVCKHCYLWWKRKAREKL